MKLYKKIVAIACLLSIVLSLMFGCSSRVDFDIAYTPEAISKFLGKVCRNVNGDYAKVIDPDYDGPASGSCYAAEIEIKLDGTVEENIQMRFFNKDDSDRVYHGQIIIYDDDSENELNCKIELIYALEKTLCGKVYADQWIADLWDVRAFGASTEFGERTTLTEYMISDNLMVTISGKGSFGQEWYVYYDIENIADD